MDNFGLPHLIQSMAQQPDLWGMGHGQNHGSQDLGLGWLYYGLARSLRPTRVVVIGSWRGFVPMLLAQALADGGEGGELLFIDPSLVDAQWTGDVEAYFASYGLNCIRHFRETSQQFLAADRLEPGSVDLLFIDGYHTDDQCRLEYEGFTPLLSERAITLFHDSSSRLVTNIYGEDHVYEHTVWRYIDALRARPELEVVNLEMAQGIALVKRRVV
jgi:predicted O-methyltransferase YrrM